MIELDPVLLARLQFAFTISFHIIFPAFTIGLARWPLWGNNDHRQGAPLILFGLPDDEAETVHYALQDP